MFGPALPPIGYGYSGNQQIRLALPASNHLDTAARLLDWTLPVPFEISLCDQ